MTVERFTVEEFETALREAAGGAEVQALGLEGSEHTFLVRLDDRVAVKVRSSIDSSGISADSGEDSIRLWLVTGGDHRSLGAKLDAYTTRVTGWQERMAGKVHELVLRRELAGDCGQCKQPLPIFKVKKAGRNRGRLFAKCNDKSHTSWVWLDEEEKKRGDREAVGQAGDAVAPGEAANERRQGVLVLPDMAGPDVQVQGDGRREQQDGPVPNLLAFLAEDEGARDGGVDLSKVEAAERDIPQPVELPLALSRDELNVHQQQVVENNVAAPTVVEACPGSGKTRTGEEQIAALITGGENPARLGYFTFSNQAAKESRRRIAQTLFPDAMPAEIAYLEDPSDEGRKTALNLTKAQFEDWIVDPRRAFIIDRVATIHALSYRLLKWRGFKLRVLAREWEWKEKELLRDTLDELDWDEGVKAVRKWISSAINSLVLPEQSEPWFAARLAALNGPVWTAPKLAEVYRRRQDFMKANGLVDFDMMQARVVYLLRNDPKFREWIESLFDVVIVDEAQDTAPIQSEILFALAPHGRIQYIGDVDQSMYNFRGAEPEVLRSKFEETWGDVTRFNLPINYRSTQRIVAWAAVLIGANYNEDSNMYYLKPFEPGPAAEQGEPVTYTELATFDALADEVAALVAEAPGDWFVLSRTRAECAHLHTRLVARGVPAINKSGGLLLGAPHVRKVLAYLRLAVDYQDARNNAEILNEIANVASASFRAPMTRRRHRDGCDSPPWINCGCPIVREEGIDYSHARYYGRRSIEKAGATWSNIKEQRWETNRGGYATVQAKGACDLVQFVERLERHADSALGCLDVVVNDCVLPFLQADEGLSDEDLAENGKAEDFQVLAQLVKHPEQTVVEYLADLDLLAAGEGAEGEAESTIVGTYHWSKGSQRPSVICNVTRLPIIPPKPIPGRLPTGLPPSEEEERRLLYVGGTRAQERAVLMGAREWNGQEMNTSLFVLQIGMV